MWPLSKTTILLALWGSQPHRNVVAVADAVRMSNDGALPSSSSEEKVQTKTCGIKRRTTSTIVTFVVTVIVVTALLVGVTMAWMNTGKTATSSPSIAPWHNLSLTKTALFQELEPWIKRTNQDEDIFQDSSSPQSRALDWLSADYIALSEDRSTTTVLERYVLAVLYYATDGTRPGGQDKI